MLGELWNGKGGGEGQSIHTVLIRIVCVSCMRIYYHVACAGPMSMHTGAHSLRVCLCWTCMPASAPTTSFEPSLMRSRVECEPHSTAAANSCRVSAAAQASRSDWLTCAGCGWWRGCEALGSLPSSAPLAPV